MAKVKAKEYGKLLVSVLPKVIETDREFDQYVAALERLDLADRNLSPEEEALRNLLAVLVKEYDDRKYPIGRKDPIEMLKHLMEENGLRQRDLLHIFGASSTLSNVITGKRSISKAQAKGLADHFRVSAELFI